MREMIVDPDADTRITGLGTVLVTSTNQTFCDAVGHMVAASGFTPAFPVALEAPWLSVTRTQPSIVVCDYDAQVKGVKRLLAEASARRVPLLVAHEADLPVNPA